MTQMVLIAGPYRSGTGDDPALMAANERAMHEVALAVFRRGHLPVTGEALALPLIRLAATADDAAAAGTPAVTGASAVAGAPAAAGTPAVTGVSAIAGAPVAAGAPGAPAAAGAPAVAGAPAPQPGTPAFDAIFHPLARRLVARCDAVLRIGGPSAGADEMVALARAHGAAVLTTLDELPELRA